VRQAHQRCQYTHTPVRYTPYAYGVSYNREGGVCVDTPPCKLSDTDGIQMADLTGRAVWLVLAYLRAVGASIKKKHFGAL
jgi:hypothetical protein